MKQSPTQDRTPAKAWLGTPPCLGPLLALGLLASMVAPCSAVPAQSLREVRRISASANDLSGVGTAAVGPDGAIWFQQYEDGVILGFAPNSTTPQRVGRSGEGPGDLRSVAQIFVRPNDIWVVDQILARTTSFDASGRVKATVSIRRPEGLVAPQLRSATPAGVTWWRSRDQNGSMILSTAPGKGSPQRTVMRFPRAPCDASRRTKTGSMSIGVPFCHDLSTAFSANGEFAAAALPLTLVDGSSGVQVVVMSATGDTVLDRRITLAASPIPRAARDSAIAVRFKRPAAGVERELIQEILNRDIVPRIYSPLVDLRLSDVGDVVVDVVSGTAAERHLAVLHRNTQQVLMVLIKRTQSLRWFGGDQVLMVDEDDDGLQDVVLYQIVANR